MEKFRILRIVYDFADKNVYTAGLAPNPYELSLAQAKLGHKVYVLTGNLNGTNLKKLCFRYELEDGNVVVYNLPRAIWKFGPFLTSSIFVLPYYFYFRLTRKIDIVHNHQQLGVWFLLYKWVFGFIDKIPVVHTNHGVIKEREKSSIRSNAVLSFMTRYFEYPIHKCSDWLSTKVANVLVAVSENTKKEIIRYYHPKQEVIVVENAVSADRFSKNGKKVNLNFKRDSVVLGNIGVLSKRKNIDVLVESLRFLPSKYKLVLVGRWQKKLERKTLTIIERFQLQERIKIVQRQSYWILDKYYRAIDIFILPSTHEGLPKVAIEALATGCKTIGSGFTISMSVPNMYYLSKVSPRSIANKILEVAQKESDYKGTRKIIEKSYSWKSKAIELDFVYKKVLTNAKRA